MGPFNLISEHAHFGLLSQGAAYRMQIRVRNDGLEACRFKARIQSSQSNARTVSVKRGGSGNVVADLALEYEPVKVRRRSFSPGFVRKYCNYTFVFSLTCSLLVCLLRRAGGPGHESHN